MIAQWGLSSGTTVTDRILTEGEGFIFGQHNLKLLCDVSRLYKFPRTNYKPFLKGNTIRKIAIAIALLVSTSAYAELKTKVKVKYLDPGTEVTEELVNSYIDKYDSGTCEVYKWQFVESDGFVRSANGDFRPNKDRLIFKLRCSN